MAGVSSCCTSYGKPGSPMKQNSATIARFLMVLFMGLILSSEVCNSFNTPYTYKSSKDYKKM